jgi:hypothetical protein
MGVWKDGEGKGASIDVKKFAGEARPSIILVVALVMLLVGLAALLLANSLRGQLEEAQGQLQDTRGELQKAQQAKNRQPGTVTKSQPPGSAKNQSQSPKSSIQEGQDQPPQGDEGSSLPYLLLSALGLVVLASLVLVVISARRLLVGGSRSGRPEATESGASTPSHTGTSDLERASPLEDGRWMTLVEECVEVVDELDEHMDSFDAPRREMAGHVIMRLEEILGRSGVEIISNDAVFDRARHKPDADHTGTDNGGAVRETLSPGFAVGPRVLRRARVRLE